MKAALSALLPLALLGCGNPVWDQRIQALGGEELGVPPGQYHRAGQPCTWCHGPYYGAGPIFSVAGTVFAIPAVDGKSHPLPLEGATVTLFDAFGDTHTTKTNCIGNFFIEQKDWDPGFPLRAEIKFHVPGSKTDNVRVMSSRINREGSCGACHLVGPAAQDTPGWVWAVDATDSPFKKPDPGCPGVKDL